MIYKNQYVSCGVHFPLVWKRENRKDNFSKNVYFFADLISKKLDLPYKNQKKMFSDCINVGVKWSPIIRLNQQKTLGQKVDPIKSYGQMNYQNIYIHKGNPVNQKN